MESKSIVDRSEDMIEDTGQNIATNPDALSLKEDPVPVSCSFACDGVGDGPHNCGNISPKSPIVENVTDNLFNEQSLGEDEVKSYPKIVVSIPYEEEEKGEEDNLKHCESISRVSPNVIETPILKQKILVDSTVDTLEDVNFKSTETDEDLEPLLTVDDTESQSSDLLSLETVSYDIIPLLGGDDDEKSVGSISSASLDLKLDSSQRSCKVSNSSSVVNLLENSLREASAAEEDPLMIDQCGHTGSSASSCLSSPSNHSSKIGSSTVQDCVHELMEDWRNSNNTLSYNSRKTKNSQTLQSEISSIALGIVEECISNALDQVLKLDSNVFPSECNSFSDCDHEHSIPEAQTSSGSEPLYVDQELMSSVNEATSKPLCQVSGPPVLSVPSSASHHVTKSSTESAECDVGDKNFLVPELSTASETSSLTACANTFSSNEGPDTHGEGNISPTVSILNDSDGSSLRNMSNESLQSIETDPNHKIPLSLSSTCSPSAFQTNNEQFSKSEDPETDKQDNSVAFKNDVITADLSSEEVCETHQSKNATIADNSSCPVPSFQNSDHASGILENVECIFLMPSVSSVSCDSVPLCLNKPCLKGTADLDTKDSLSPCSTKQSNNLELQARSFVEEILATATLKVESGAHMYNPTTAADKIHDSEAHKVASALVDQIVCSAESQVREIFKLRHLQGHSEEIVETFDSAKCVMTNESGLDCLNQGDKVVGDIFCGEYRHSPLEEEEHERKTAQTSDISNEESHSCDMAKDCNLNIWPDVLLSTQIFDSNSTCEKSDLGLKEEELDSSCSESKSISPESITTSDSARCSSYSTIDSTVRKEASLFVDGVIEMAVKQYEDETSSSSEASPTGERRPGFAVEFPPQEEEELATPCGEMVTEHFMDFESGRNVSVFCSTEDNSAISCDHLSPFDRVFNTIGNREVDSDTGKSVCVFRSEEDIFYEIQRASTCTSVFESVEEEDEDMVDTTAVVKNTSDTVNLGNETSSELENNGADTIKKSSDKDIDAFEDAVDAFLEKERLARDELRPSNISAQDDEIDSQPEELEILQRNELRKRQEIDFKHFEDAICQSVQTGQSESELSTMEERRLMAERWANGVPDTPDMREKQNAIREALDSEIDVASKLCKLALTEGGLINDALRREAWPRMLGLDPTLEISAPSLDDLKSHPEFEQVVLDVNRSLKRFPPDIPREQRETLQDKLTRLIMFVISKHPHLKYYQGYHDVAVTFLLVVGEAAALQIMERLSTEHLSDCMQPTMERTSYLLHFIYPLIHRLHPTLAEYLERSEVGTMFCLPWFLTWFGHSLNRYQDVVRLYDHFLASPPLAPLYLAAVLVAHRADEVLAVDCDMAAIHALLSNIPDTLPLEILLRDATDLYLRYPPESIEKEVEERFRNEQDLRSHEAEARERRRQQRALQNRHSSNRGSGSWQLAELQQRVGPAVMLFNRWIPPWVAQQQRLPFRLLFASATFFFGFYVYARGDVFP